MSIAQPPLPDEKNLKKVRNYPLEVLCLIQFAVIMYLFAWGSGKDARFIEHTLDDAMEGRKDREKFDNVMEFLNKHEVVAFDSIGSFANHR